MKAFTRKRQRSSDLVAHVSGGDDVKSAKKAEVIDLTSNSRAKTSAPQEEKEVKKTTGVETEQPYWLYPPDLNLPPDDDDDDDDKGPREVKLNDLPRQRDSSPSPLRVSLGSIQDIEEQDAGAGVDHSMELRHAAAPAALRIPGTPSTADKDDDDEEQTRASSLQFSLNPPAQPRSHEDDERECEPPLKRRRLGDGNRKGALIARFHDLEAQIRAEEDVLSNLRRELRDVMWKLSELA